MITPWMVVAIGVALGMVLGIWLQHLAELAKLRATSRTADDARDEWFDEGVEFAASLAATHSNIFVREFAR